MSNEVLFDQKGQLGFITLNRPETLNALTLPMIKAMQKQLTLWKNDNQIKAVVLQASKGKAFCAGGDIRSLYESGKKDPKLARNFFWHEYRLNYFIHHLGKPYLALMDGITMGGGVGIALHGSHPIAGTHFSFAMPETGIGFFPDIGASFLLARASGKIGIFLGLTGERINAEDALAASLVKARLPSERISNFIEALLQLNLSEDVQNKIEECIQEYALSSELPLILLNPLINRVFAYDSIEAIFNALEASNNAWAEKVLLQLKQKSPLSLKVTLAQLLAAKDLSLADCLKMDYQLASNFLHEHDFYEGVRALIIDKDKKPQWKPSSLSLVTKKKVMYCFNNKASVLEF